MSTLRARLTGLAGVLGILAVVVGAPLTLIAIGANPLPSRIPSWQEITSTLTGVDDGTAMLTAFAVLAWAAWAYLALGVVVEIIARARGLRAPHIPALALPQSAGRALVSAALLLFTALPTTALAPPAAAAAAPVVAVAPLRVAPAGAADQGDGLAADGRVSAEPAAPAPVGEVHTVRPGETLWGIAELYLGDGVRFVEIAQANYGLTQTDGRALTSGHRIHPGWKLTIPAAVTEEAPAGGVEEYTVRPGDTLWGIAGDELGDPTRYPEIYAASTHITQPGGHHLSDPDEISPGWTLHVPGPGVDGPAAEQSAPPVIEAPTPPSPPADPAVEATATPDPVTEPVPAPPAAASDAVSADAVSDDASEASDANEVGSWPVRTPTGVGSLLAACVVALITARRGALQRRRRPGKPSPMPTGEAADVELSLRAVADPFAVDSVDTALRILARACAEAGQPLPIVRWARLSAGQLDLHLAEPAQLPEPWTGTSDALTWTLDVEHVDSLDSAAVAGVPSPYPALVTVGHDLDDAHILLDLEHVGALAVVGDFDRTRQVLAALAVELATSAWADDLRVTTVLGYVGLEDALQTGRIRYQPSVGYLLEDLTARAAADRAALAAAGAPDLPNARVTGAAPDAWIPEVLLLACPLTARHRNLLTALVEEQPRVAIAAVTTDDEIGEWTLTLGEGDDVGTLEPLGLRLRPQRLDPVVYDHILELANPIVTPDPDTPPSGVGQTEVADCVAGATDESAKPLRVAAGATTSPAPHPTAPPAGGVGPQTLPNPSEQDVRGIVDNVGQGSEPLPNPIGQRSEISPGAAGDVDNAVVSSSGTPEGSTAGRPPENGAAEAGASWPDGAGRPPARPAPYIKVLGPVTVEHARENVEASRRSRLTEYAAYLALHPGATFAAIDDAIWPDRRAEDNFGTRHAATSRLRSWLGEDADGRAFFPTHQGTGYAFQSAVRTDWDGWRALLPDGPLSASSEDLEQALALVRGRPFDGVHRRRYAWAEPLRREMIDQIVDASHELARRRASEGDWRGAEDAVVVGLALDPGLERLWRVRILAAHATDAATTRSETIDRMLTVTDDLGGDLEPETEALLAAIEHDADLADLEAIAL